MNRPWSLLPFFTLLLLLAIPSLGLASEEDFASYKASGIVVAQESEMAPMSFVGLNGVPNGYVVDLWLKWSAETGIPVHFHLVDWADSVQAVRDGKADVHGGLFYTKERDKTLDYSVPFFPAKGALFVKKGANIANLSQLPNKRVGVIAKSFFEDFMHREYPNLNVISARTSADLVTKADAGEVDAFVADYPTLMYQIGSMGMGHDFEVVEFLTEQEFRAAVAEGNDSLLVVIEKGLRLIDESERQTILNRWIISEHESSMGWLVPVAGFTGLSLLVALFVPFLFDRRQRRKN